MNLRKIRILYGTTSVGGGALKHLAYLVCGLDHGRFEVFVLLPDSHNGPDAARDLEAMRKAGAVLLELPLRTEISPFRDLWAVARIVRLLHRYRIDIVHAHSSKAGALLRPAAWLTRRKGVLYTPHCYYHLSRKGFARRVFTGIERLLSRLTDRVVVSETEREEMRRSHIASPERIAVIDNTIDPSRYRRYDRREALDRLGLPFPPDAPIIGGVGRLVPQKDWDTFVSAAAEIARSRNDVRFLIAGDGIREAALRERIHREGLGSRIRLLGFVQDISLVYSCLDAFLSTSLWEGLPYAYLEARFFGLPLFISDTGPFPLTGRDRMLPRGDHRAFAAEITSFLEKRQAPERQASRPDFDAFIRKHESLYTELYRSRMDRPVPERTKN